VKTSTKSRGSVTPPASIQGRQGPHRERVRSDKPPTTGFQRTSKNFGTSTARPATAAGTARVSVRKSSRTRPGTVPKVPVATDASAYPATVLRGSTSPPPPLLAAMASHGGRIIRAPQAIAQGFAVVGRQAGDVPPRVVRHLEV